MDATRRIAIIDVTDEPTFARLPRCADPGFDHRSCDYWEDAERGSRAARLDWIEPSGHASVSSSPPGGQGISRRAPGNPFLADRVERPDNPFALPGARASASNPFRIDDDEGPADNPFAPSRVPRPAVPDGAPRKLRLLGRGLGVVGSYAKVLLLDDEPAVYGQFGPLSAYPRAQRTRDLYPALPDAPLPAVITCVATTGPARGLGLARHLAEAICDDLARRGFAAVEAYPEVGARPDATSSATPAFWQGLGFVVAAQDLRFPVLRRELT
ncbi:MAG: hypothetical protein ABIQ58_03415 [Candidatus Limnocylindrales bacterium]